MTDDNTENKNVNDINERAQEIADKIIEQKMNDLYAAELELEASIDEINQTYNSTELRKIIRISRINSLRALNEAIDALGDIIKNCTKQQKKAYELCVKTRDNLLKTTQEVVK